MDLDAGRHTGRIAGLTEPQGVAWFPAEHELVVACGDGSVHFYDAERREVARINLGDDADNVRVDPRSGLSSSAMKKVASPRSIRSTISFSTG